nr:putative reverse transcriptase domain-containing protein [Tanacetum cinerariifolium]
MTDKVVLIKEKFKAARYRQKSYADNRRKPLEFKVRDRVLLKVSPWKGVICFGTNGKLAPRYVGPFKILERIGPVAYWLRLPVELSSVHDTFHVLNLKKCLTDVKSQDELSLRRGYYDNHDLNSVGDWDRISMPTQYLIGSEEYAYPVYDFDDLGVTQLTMYKDSCSPTSRGMDFLR